MGLFTDVKIDISLLPDDCKELNEWQTKDVVDPQMETLIIDKDGRLIYVWYDREWHDDKSRSMFGGYLKPTEKHEDVLDYHGDMRFGNAEKEMIARFDDGKLRYIREVK